MHSCIIVILFIFSAVEYRFTLQRTRSAWQEHINCHDVDKEETMGPTLATYSVPGKMVSAVLSCLVYVIVGFNVHSFDELIHVVVYRL